MRRFVPTSRTLPGAILWCVVACCVSMAQADADARSASYSSQLRESEVARDVLHAALSSRLTAPLRIRSTSATYLAGQGTYFEVDLGGSWLVLGRGEPDAIDITADIEGLEDVPEMLRNIFSELKIAVNVTDAEELSELREIRNEQRELRQEMRELRAALRSARRTLIRTDDADDRSEIEAEIAELQSRLDRYRAESGRLESDIQSVYKGLEADAQREPVSALGTSHEVDIAIAASACTAAEELDSLGDNEHLSVGLRRSNVTHLFVFRLKDARDCGSPEKLLDKAQRYTQGANSSL